MALDGLLVAMTFRDELDHAALARAQRAVAPIGLEGMQRGFGGRAREEWIVMRDRVDGRHQQTLGVGFENVTKAPARSES